MIAEKNRRNEKQRFAIRKLNVGVASVLLGITFSIYGGGQVVAHADTANASDQVATSDTGGNSLATKSEVALSSAASSANQSSISATSANGAVQRQASANSQTAVTANTPASDNAVASNAAVEATKNQSTAENQPSASQKVQTPAQAQPVAQENGSSDASLNVTRQVLNTITNRNSMPVANYLTSFAAVPASDSVETTTLNSFTNQETNANALAESKVAATALAAEAEDPNTKTVTTAKEFIDAIQNGTYTTINVANNINMGDIKTGENINVDITNKRNITIQSSGATKNTVDFNGYSFKMNSNDYGVTFKNITLYGRSYFGIIRNAGSYTFDNVDYTGSQLVYTEAGYNSTVNFNGTVNANSVASYVGLNGTTYKTQGGGNQQVLQFRSGTNTINFNENSTVNLVTTNANVIENGGGTTNINVKKGANVILEPHTQTGMEQFFSVNGIARGIASNATTNLTIDEGANLNISLKDNPDDAYHSSALYLNSGATIKNNGNLTITSDGTPYYKPSGIDAPVYINGTAVINVGNTGNLTLTATNLGTYNGDLMKINGTGTVSLDPHSTFKISGDGTGALTAINLSSGSTFTSDQPKEFTIDLSANTSSGKTLIKNGTINFTRVKNTNVASQYQVALGKVDVTYSSNGTLSNSVVTSLNKDVPTTIYDYIKTNPSALSFVAAGEDVTLNSLHLDKNNQLTGIATSTGDSKTPIYITVLINNSATGVPEAGMYRLYTDTDGNITTTKVTYTGTPKNPDGSPKPNGGEFSIDLSSLASQLTDDAKITVVASKDFVESPTLTETVEALRQVNIDALQKLVDAAPEEEQKPSYYNASEEAQKAYTDAIAAGQDILDNPTSYDQSDVDGAVSVIQLALTALTGKETDKTALQTAVDQASSVESSDNYTNADTRLQDNYQAAINAGQGILSKENATQTEVDNALTTINNAKDALNGDAKKAASKEALQKAVDNSATVKESNNYTNADETQKTAYDNAVTAAQTVLDKTNATQAEVNQALQNLETANNNLNGNAKTEAANKAALEAAVKDAPNVRNTSAYYNGSDEAQATYNNAITAGQAVLNETNPSASDVKTALDAINAAKDNLKGEATNTAALKTALTNANNTKNTGNYTNADQANQEALNNAITAGQEILKNTTATQAEVDNAAKAITEAINGLNGDTNLAKAKTAATEDIQKALDTKTTQITDATNIDQATKDQLIADAKKAAEDANTAINQATDPNAVNTAKDKGTTNINKVTVPSLEDAKTKAAANIDQALTDKTKEINNAENIDQATKDRLIKEATDAATTAKDAIEKSTTNDEATKAGQAGVDAINNVKVPSVTDSQNAAKEVIDNALNSKTKEINAATNIDQITKDQLIKEATDAANNAKEAIDQATTADAIKTARDEGTTNINNVTVPSLEDAKKAATKAVDDALTAQTEVINKADNLSDTEKKDLIDQATAEANKAKENIETATTNNEAAQAGKAGVDAIKKIVPTSLDTVKSDANKAIEAALTKKLEKINSANALTTDEKTALTQEATTAADKAKAEITKATTNDAVIEAQNNGVTAIDGIKVPTESAAKEAAKKAVAEAATAKNNAIDASNLTDEEKAALKQKVTEAQNAADQAIDNATTNVAVTEAQNNGIKAINGIEVTTSTAKEAAKKAVAEAATAKNNAIDASNLTAEEKATLKQKVTEAQTAADQAIDKATTNTAVTEAQNKGIADIANVTVPSLDQVKQDAINAIKQVQDAKNKQIAAASNLSAEEQKELTDQVDKIANDAIAKINDAATTTNDAVTATRDEAIKQITDLFIPTLDGAQTDAINAIESAKNAKLNDINNAAHLTDREKQALVDQTNKAADEATKAIKSAQTNDAVKGAETAGLDSINNITIPTLVQKQQEAIEELNAARDAKNSAIDNAADLTTDEKNALKDKVQAEYSNAVSNITSATTDEAVTTAKENGIAAIKDIQIPTKSAAKDQAKNLIDDVLNEKKNEINNAQNLSDNQKQDLINQATDEADQAKKNIDNATTNNDVQTAEDNGAQAIENVTVPSLDEAKKASTKVIDEVLKEKTAEINAATNLSNTEKDALIKDATTAANTAKDNIAKATTNDAVKDAETDGVKAILDIKVPGREDQQKDAIAALDRALADKVSEIDNANNLSETTKQDLKQQAQAAYTTAVDNVNNAQTSAEINAARDNGVQAILDITVPTLTDAQDASITAVEQVRDAKKTQIEAAKNLTETQKEALKNQVDEIADKAIDNIKNATTDATVKDAETAGINEILNVTIPTLDAAKSDAKQAIADALTAKTAEINAAQNLTDAEKQKLIDQAQTEAAAANKNIDAATTNDAAELAAKNGVQAILDIQVPTVEETRDQAKKNVDNALNSKKEEINNSNLSPAAKEELINEAEQAAENARTAIDNATTASAISEAEAAGIAAIENIKVSNAPTESD